MSACATLLNGLHSIIINDAQGYIPTHLMYVYSKLLKRRFDVQAQEQK